MEFTASISSGSPEFFITFKLSLKRTCSR